MSLYRTFHPERMKSAKPARRLYLAFCGLLTVTATWAIAFGLGNSASVGCQIYSVMGCRSRAEMLTLTLEDDGRVLWPDGTRCTAAEAALLLPAWQAKTEEPVVALLANPDVGMIKAAPLLEAARELGLRVILAVPQNYRMPSA